MSNMSYCRFQNTLSDLRDCQDALQEIAGLTDLSTEEARAAKGLIETCREIIADAKDNALVEADE